MKKFSILVLNKFSYYLITRNGLQTAYIHNAHVHLISLKNYRSQNPLYFIKLLEYFYNCKISDSNI